MLPMTAEAAVVSLVETLSSYMVSFSYFAAQPDRFLPENEELVTARTM